MPYPVLQSSDFIYPGALGTPATAVVTLPHITAGNTIVLCYYGGVPEYPASSGSPGPVTDGNVTWTPQVQVADPVQNSVGCVGIYTGHINATKNTTTTFFFTLEYSTPTFAVLELSGQWLVDATGHNNPLDENFISVTTSSVLNEPNEFVIAAVNPNSTSLTEPSYVYSKASTGGAVFGYQWSTNTVVNTTPLASWNQTPANNALLAIAALVPPVSESTGGSTSTTSTAQSYVLEKINATGTSIGTSVAFAYTTSSEKYYTDGNTSSISSDQGVLGIELQLDGSSVSTTDAENPITALFLRTPYGSSTSTSDVEDALLSSEVIGGAISISTTHIGLDEVVERDAIFGSSTSVSSMSGVSQNQGTAPIAGRTISTSSVQLLGVQEADRVTSLGASIGASAASGAPQSFKSVSGSTVVANSVDTGAEMSYLTEPDTGSMTSISSVGNSSMSVRASISTQAAVAVSSSIGIETKAELFLLVGTSKSASNALTSESYLAHFFTAGASISSTADLDIKPVTEMATIINAHSMSLTGTGAAETSIINYVISSTDVGQAVESVPVDTVRAALLSHLNDTYVVPDIKTWEIENERARRAQAFYRMGEYGIFVLLWNYQDFENNLVTRCKTCYVTEGSIENTWKQPGYFKCPDCLGTTFEGGYKALLVRPSLWTWEEPTIRQDRKGVINTDTGTVQTTGDFRMQPKDYIIRGDGTRWQVSMVQADHLDTGFGTQSGPWNTVSYTYPNVARENESSPIYLLSITEATIQEQITQYYSRKPIS